MEQFAATTDHRKRRRRRRKASRLPISARVVLDDQIRDDIGILSKDLFVDLFGTALYHDTKDVKDEVQYIGICPWTPPSLGLVNGSHWTLFPVRATPREDYDTESSAHSLLRLPASPVVVQSLAESLPSLATWRGSTTKGKVGIEVLVLDVQPLVLDTIAVKVEDDALQKHEEVQRRFGGGFGHSNANGSVSKGKGKARATQSSPSTIPVGIISKQNKQDELMSVIRGALSSPRVVHIDDLLPLPLPPHPITHVSLPPLKVSMCEPVSQGLICGRTKVIIDRVSRDDHGRYPSHSSTRAKALQRMISEEAEDTANEQFYSAVEDDQHDSHQRGHGDKKLSSSSSNPESSDSENGSLSDDSLDGMISLSSPNLPSHSPWANSSMTTPRVGHPRTNGVSTPGSVFSSYTSTTARQGPTFPGKLFQTRPLLHKVPDELLYPTPSGEEDEEVRVFVDVKFLAKIGCFSGDWIRVTPSSRPQDNEKGLWGIGAFGNDGSTNDSRPVKVYGLPDSPIPKSPRNRARQRRPSIMNESNGRGTPTVWLSPILLTNLNHPVYLTLSLFQTTSQVVKGPGGLKIPNSATPPFAEQVTLLKVLSPLSSEKALQNGQFASLKQYFELKHRVLREGDLIGISVDVGVSKIMSQSSDASIGDDDTEVLINASRNDVSPKIGNVEVVWFKVGQIQRMATEDNHEAINDDLWFGTASIVPQETSMRQVGNEEHRVPATTTNSWEYYLGVKQLPKARLPSSPLQFSVDRTPKAQVTPLGKHLYDLLDVVTSPSAVNLGLKPVVILLHSTQRNIGKAHLGRSVCAEIGLHTFPIDAYDILTEGGAGGGDVKTEAFLKARADRALSCGAENTVPLIKHIEALSTDRITSALEDVIGNFKAVIMTTTELEKIPEGIRSLVTHELELTAPNETDRERIIVDVITERGLSIAYDVDLAAIAVKTAALVAGDLVDIVERAATARQDRLEQLTDNEVEIAGFSKRVLVRDIIVSGGEGALCLTRHDFDIAVEAARKNFADAIGAPRIPNVSWDDVGGLTNVKDAVMETIQLPLERPELFAKGMKKRSGILFYGPPGTGKTLLAKAIATEFSLNFFSVKGPELLNMYIGESEANVRRVFQRARDARPCVVFFDELDSVAPKRGNQGDSGGVMDRIVSQLLAELDGMSNGEGGSGGVFVIGATNRPDLLDQALLRPGRFDKMLYLGVSDTHEKQLTILEALTRKFNLDSSVSLRRIAGGLPFTYTGADLYALCSDAMLKAVTRQAAIVDAKIKTLPGGPFSTAFFFDHFATKEDTAVLVTEDDFSAAQGELVSSVR